MYNKKLLGNVIPKPYYNLVLKKKGNNLNNALCIKVKNFLNYLYYIWKKNYIYIPKEKKNFIVIFFVSQYFNKIIHWLS